MINTKRPNSDDYTQVGFIEAEDNQGNYQNIDHIYDSEGNIVFQQGYLNEYDGADNFRIPAIGKPLIDYTIYGNTFQDGVPTPDNSIMPQGTGERTGNLWAGDVPQYRYAKDYKKYNPDNAVYIKAGTYTISSDGKLPNIQAFDDNHTQYSVSEIMTFPNTYYSVWNELSICPISAAIHTATITILADCIITLTVVDNLGTYIMLNVGSTALPYEPYGIKIPISSASTTTPVYLGEVQTTRKVKKYEFNGRENFNIDERLRFNVFISDIKYVSGGRKGRSYCTHYECLYNSEPYDDNWNNVYYQSGGSLYFHDKRFTVLDDFKTYLQQQYSAGTPVTIWYVLATSTTGIVNEPLMKIGGYADSVDFSQAGVEIPTLKRPNTTEIDITTSLPPSEVYAKYRGSKTQKYDLFLAANGDSFEAKNGQSLYIGDDT